MAGAIALHNGKAQGTIAFLLLVVAGCDYQTPVEAPPLVAAATSPMAIGPDGPVKVYTGEEVIAWGVPYWVVRVIRYRPQVHAPPWVYNPALDVTRPSTSPRS